MEVRHLRCFLAVAEEGSVTAAAARLRRGQPAVSRTLAALERGLGVRLVDRSTHHLALTAEGAAFRVRARAAVAAFDEAVSLVGAPRALRLGHAWSAAGRFTTPLLRSWRERRPDVPLELLRVDDRTAGLLRGVVDLALLRGPVTEPGLVAVELYAEPRVAAVPVDSVWAERARIGLGELAGGTLARNTVSGSTTPELWPSGARPVSTLTVGNTDDWLAAIAAGLAFGVTARATAAMHAYPGVTFVPLSDAPPLSVSLVRRAGREREEVREFVALAREVTAAARGGEAG
ncbi:LysR family transcriptional regulator [Streptomyces sp. DSM 41982]|uniref:LysR family transcriptional regulator n=1 Tax=Streptomyces evansiae TaxID=3075535 RepID=A0ABD5ECT1_9ACTN|nr:MULTISPECIES: LysR family transcriptional regulator [unclassified Streptomyces]MDT0419178.1 LysR family transcriptional regulator [Streptomyces sp. DSM 41982]